MNLKWSLNELYTSFDSDEFKQDLEESNELIDEVNKWASANLKSHDHAMSKIEYYISAGIKISNLLSKMMGFANLIASVDARNEQAITTSDKLAKMLNQLTEPSVKFQKWLSSLDNLQELINSSVLLKEHSFYLWETVEKSKYLLEEEIEGLLDKMVDSGSRGWRNLYNKAVSTLLVDIKLDGEQKQLPLPVIRNLAYNPDQNIRKTAYEAELASYKKIEEPVAACLNGIKGEVITVGEIRGYESPLDEAVKKSRIDMETLEAMLSAIKEYLPDFQKYYRRKGELLGHNNGLPFYDLFAPVGEMDMKFTYDEAHTYIVKCLRTFSDRLADFADNAFEKRWIDSEPREGKRGGAFCAGLHAIGESRVLANFDGSFNSVTTLAHELGHAYHNAQLNDESILNSGYTMPIAETASIFNETIVTNATLGEATNSQAFGILEASISGAGQVIVDILSRFLFESEVFNRRKDHALSVNEFKGIMINAQKEAYGNGLDPEILHPYMWINKSHYYSAELSFYNFPYAFGLLFGKGIYAEYLKRGADFVPEYNKLLNATGKNRIVEVAKMVDIDIHSIDFWRNSLEIVKKDIDKFMELSNKMI